MIDSGKRIPWQPAIYEHKAALIGQTPEAVSRSSDLLVEAVLREFEIYGADYLTVGLDVYNIEAEALGAHTMVPAPHACPDLEGPILDLENLPDELTLPEIPAAGRFALFLDAGQRVRDRLGTRTRVRVAASGPVTLAIKLTNMEDVIMSLCTEDEYAQRLLEFTTDVCLKWLSCLRTHDLDVVVFDSMAAPPMFSPTLYEQHVLPLHQRLMEQLRASGQEERELIIGGDTTPLAALLPQTGANLLLCDYAADAMAFKKALGDDQAFSVRRNISPVALQREDHDALARTFLQDLSLFTHPVAGTGILPYDFVPDQLLHFCKQLDALSNP